MAEPIDRRHDRLLRLPEVRHRVGLSTSTIYRKMGLGEFPQRIQISTNIVAWYESDIDRFVANPTGYLVEHR